MLAIMFLIKNNGVVQNWIAAPFLSDSFVLNKNGIALASSQSCCSVDANAWCKALCTFNVCIVCIGSMTTNDGVHT